jgi:hypothetical protein
MVTTLSRPSSSRAHPARADGAIPGVQAPPVTVFVLVYLILGVVDLGPRERPH